MLVHFSSLPSHRQQTQWGSSLSVAGMLSHSGAGETGLGGVEFVIVEIHFGKKVKTGIHCPKEILLHLADSFHHCVIAIFCYIQYRQPLQ